MEIDLSEHYEACSKYGRWCLKKDTNAVLDVCMNDEELNLTIDRTKLQREEAGAIKLKLRAKVVQKYGYFADLITDLEHKLQDTWDEEKVRFFTFSLIETSVITTRTTTDCSNRRLILEPSSFNFQRA